MMCHTYICGKEQEFIWSLERAHSDKSPDWRTRNREWDKGRQEAHDASPRSPASYA